MNILNLAHFITNCCQYFLYTTLTVTMSLPVRLLFVTYVIKYITGNKCVVLTHFISFVSILLKFENSRRVTIFFII